MQRPELKGSPYEAVEPLGFGGNATVWRARHRQSGEEVAVKVLHDNVLNFEDMQRLIQEVEILQSLRHPALVRVFATGATTTGNPYVVMELVLGTNLRQLLVKSPLPPFADIRTIVEQVCGALVEAHVAGIVHRDVKPENVLLGGPEWRQVKLVDFGTAKRLGPKAPVLTMDDKLLGTPHYMSPERCTGKPVGGAADVYAVAVMTYEMVAGHVPFDGRTGLQVAMKHVREPPPPIPDVSAELQEAVFWGLTKDPTHRPSAEQFAERLCRALDEAQAAEVQP
jgi:serine/threonine protein kinase